MTANLIFTNKHVYSFRYSFMNISHVCCCFRQWNIFVHFFVEPNLIGFIKFSHHFRISSERNYKVFSCCTGAIKFRLFLYRMERPALVLCWDATLFRCPSRLWVLWEKCKLSTTLHKRLKQFIRIWLSIRQQRSDREFGVRTCLLLVRITTCRRQISRGGVLRPSKLEVDAEARKSRRSLESTKEECSQLNWIDSDEKGKECSRVASSGRFLPSA